MCVKRLEIENYKCFLDRQIFEFEPGFNLLLGANNAGKTSVMEALDLVGAPNVPHASTRNLTSFGQKNSNPSQFEYVLVASPADLLDVADEGQIYLPIRDNSLVDSSPSGVAKFGAQLMAETQWVVSFETSGSQVTRSAYRDAQVSSKAVTIQPQGHQQAIGVTRRHAGDLSFVFTGYPGHGFASQARALHKRIYRFAANRTPPAVSGTGIDGALQRNAGNLPFCINWLHTSDSDVHRELCILVSRVLPSVAWVQAPPILGNPGQFQLQCRPNPPAMQRGDLAVSLDQMGAGVGNVIAILYVMLTSRQPTVICIDEPNQFLHPRALRELMQILAVEGRRHQYIISAHSAEMLTAISPASIAVLSLREGSVTVQSTRDKDLSNLRAGLSDLGIRLTELHGRDSVLWVEGQTEEEVLPDLLRHYCPKVAAGMAVVRVHDTGAFDKRGVDPIKVTQIHEKLTQATALVPPMVCVILDAEKRKSEDRARLEMESGGKLRFLPRRMLENFILSPQAIRARLAEEGEAFDCAVIAAAMCEFAGVDQLEAIDLVAVDGAKLLEAVFQRLSDSRVEFRKTRDVPAMVRWQLQQEPHFLDPLGSWLGAVVAGGRH